jgi:hypothetical protein
MAIDLSPEIEARIKAKAYAEGVSVAEYVERLVSEEDGRRTRLAAFRQAINERLSSLSSGRAWMVKRSWPDSSPNSMSLDQSALLSEAISWPLRGRRPSRDPRSHSG